MQPFTTMTGLVAPLDRVNVDTDQIIPKQFLKTIKRTGLREGLDRRVNMPLGRSSTRASVVSSRRASRTSSTTTVSKTACCRWC